MRFPVVHLPIDNVLPGRGEILVTLEVIILILNQSVGILVLQISFHELG
jgi:hypothetical protein